MDLLSAGAGTVSVWMELLSTETGMPGIPRTLLTKGRSWEKDRVEWSTEDPAAEAECALHSLEGGLQTCLAGRHSPLWVGRLSAAGKNILT